MQAIEFLQWGKFFDKKNFSAILTIIANAPEGDIWLASQLSRRKFETSEVGLQIFWENAGKQHFPTFLAIIEKSNCENSVACLVAALKSNIKKKDQSVLEYLLKDSNFSENYFRLLLKIISQSKGQSNVFFEWLTSPNQKSWMPLQSIFWENPNYLIPFLEEAEKNFNVATLIVPALEKPSPSGETIWDIILNPNCELVSEQVLEKILNLISALTDNEKKEKKVANTSYSPYSSFWTLSRPSEEGDANRIYIDSHKSRY